MKPFQSRWRRLAIAVVLLIAALAAYRLISPPDSGPRLLSVPVRVADLEETVLASGTIQAFDQVSVGAQVSGQLKSLKVALGDDVKKGQLVAEIDSLTQQNALKTAEAQLDNVQAQKKAKQATLRQAELAFERQKKMLDKDANSHADYESAEATLAQTRADIAALEAQIRQARVSVDTAKVNLGYTQITSPIDGKVVAVVTKEGQTVNSNQSAPTIIKVAKLRTVTVKAQVSEADVTRIKPGQRVYFTILGEPDHRYQTRLRAVEPAPDSISDTSTTSTSSTSSSSSSSSAIYYNAMFDVPNPEGKLRISMTTEVNIVLAEARQVLTIPASALDKAGPDGRYRVRVEGPEHRIEQRLVRIGMNNKVDAQVLDGLKAGEKIVIGEATAASASDSTSSQRRGPPPMM